MPCNPLFKDKKLVLGQMSEQQCHLYLIVCWGRLQINHLYVDFRFGFLCCRFFVPTRQKTEDKKVHQRL